MCWHPLTWWTNSSVQLPKSVMIAERSPPWLATKATLSAPACGTGTGNKQFINRTNVCYRLQFKKTSYSKLCDRALRMCSAFTVYEPISVIYWFCFNIAGSINQTYTIQQLYNSYYMDSAINQCIFFFECIIRPGFNTTLSSALPGEKLKAL